MRILVGLFVSLAFVLAPAVELQAALVTYSSSGTISRIGAPDPWSIGAGPVGFSFSVTLDQALVDGDPTLNRADFFGAGKFSAATMIVNGSPATVNLSYAFSDANFGDNTGVLGSDQLSFGLSATLGANTEPVSISLLLPSSTFALTTSLQSPPVFGSTSTIATFGTSSSVSGGAYRFDIAPGTAVTVTTDAASVPEPASFVQLGLCIAGCVGFWHRTRKRR